MNTQTTSFRHNILTSEEIMDIINYMEKEMPGVTFKPTDAIKYAIRYTAGMSRGEYLKQAPQAPQE